MTPTATARIEKTVTNWLRQHAVPGVYRYEIAKLILAERARLKRGVRQVTAFRCLDIQTQEEYTCVKRTDLLKLWEG